MVFDLVQKDKRLKTGKILNNEFKERSFVFKDTLGISWQIIEKKKTKNHPIKKIIFNTIEG